MTSSGENGRLRIIGIDLATDAKKVGLALCVPQAPRPRLLDVLVAKTWSGIDAQILQWVQGPTLLALDAPLGWPKRLGESLHRHRAGAPLESEANELFRRATDKRVAEALRKYPLDVGADRIARTAHTALSLLGRLAEALGRSVPLAWSPDSIVAVSAIEVYPAGTLASRALPHSGYKGASDTALARRHGLAEAMGKELSVETSAAQRIVESDHALDAVLCALAGLDFLAGEVIVPEDLELAKREGWIWVRPAVAGDKQS